MTFERSFENFIQILSEEEITPEISPSALADLSKEFFVRSIFMNNRPFPEENFRRYMTRIRQGFAAPLRALAAQSSIPSEYKRILNKRITIFGERGRPFKETSDSRPDSRSPSFICRTASRKEGSLFARHFPVRMIKEAGNSLSCWSIAGETPRMCRCI